MRDNSLAQVFGENVKNLRVSAGWSQVDLSQKMGLAQSAVSKIEKGAYSFSADTLSLAAHVFQRKPWELLKPEAHIRTHAESNHHLSAGATSGELSAADGAVILSEMAKLSLPQRNFLLAILFRDASLADGTGESALSAALQVIQKAE